MIKTLFFTLLSLLSASAVCAEPAASVPKYLTYSLSSSGYGPVKIGMSVKKASAALGVKLSSGKNKSKPGFSKAKYKKCHFVTPKARDVGLAFMVEKGVITRVDVTKGNIKTFSGLKIGSKASYVKAKYGKSLRIEPHKSGSDDDKYYSVRVSSKNDMLFEVIQGKVATFRGGLATSVARVEGCLE